MSQIEIPETPNLDPSRILKPPEIQPFVAQLPPYALPGSTDVAGNQDPPTGFYGASGFAELEGNYVQYTSPTIESLSDELGSYNTVDGVVQSTLGMNWKRSGANPNIIESYRLSGWEWPTDNLPFAATFVTWVMKQSNINGLQNMSSQAYAMFGDEVDWPTWVNVRKNDLVVLKSRSKPGGHVGFIQTYNPRNATFELIGGNQSNDVKISRFEVDDGDLYVRTVRRYWKIPKSADKPLFDLGGSFPNIGLESR